MKKFYTLICAGFLFSFSASAQWSGGQFMAVRAGNWVPTGPTDPTIWVSGDGVHNGAPPSVANPGPAGPNQGLCNNCLIDLQVVGGGTVTLNTGVTLTGGSELRVGPGVTLLITPSHAANPTSANGVILTDQNPGQINRIVWQDGTAKVDASQLTAADQYDGVYTSVQNTSVSPTAYTLTKQIGVAPKVFQGTSPTSFSVTDAGNAVYGNGLSLAGPLTLANNSGVVSLPIIISAFSATLVDGNAVNLAWTTTLESNADHFAIQRSVDAGSHWATLGTEVCKGGTVATDYTYTDENPATGTSQYRLQLVDKDGTYKYSEVKVIRNSLISAVSIFPNPAHDYVNVALGGKSTLNVLISLYNQNGQLVQMKNVQNAGGTTVPLSVSGYAVGSYTLVVNSSDGSKQVSKLLISK